MTFTPVHDAGTPTDGCGDPRMLQPGLIHGQGRLARRGIGGGDPDPGGSIFGLGMGRDGSGQQFLGSPELGLCFAEQGTVAGQDGLSAGDLCLKLAVIEAEQEISGHNVRTVVDVPLDDGAIHASPHGDSRRWFDPADARPCDGHRLCPDRSGDDRDRGCALLRERGPNGCWRLRGQT